MQAAEYSRGDRVRYIPHHADNDISHPDCEDGTVDSVGLLGHVFVMYDGGQVPASTQPENLVKL